MPAYSLYGLTIYSDHALRGLDALEQEGPPDVEIVTVAAQPVEDVLPETPVWTLRETFYTAYQLFEGRGSRGTYLRLRYEVASYAADFVIGPGGATIWVGWNADTAFHDVNTLLLGPILGRTLRMRGVLVLHAGAVAVDGRVCCFVGDKGAGKSTTTAALAQQGHPVLTDDLAALDLTSSIVAVYTGHSRIRLRPDAANAIGQDALLTPIWSQNHPVQKYYLDAPLTTEVREDPLPLGAVYVLGDRVPNAPPRIEHMEPARAHIELLRHTYAGALLNPQQRAQEFDQMARVVSVVPVRRVRRGQGLEAIPAICDAILEDFSSVSQHSG